MVMVTRAQHTRQGFTIVELLIVIVIIGILAAIVIVAYNGIQNRAYDASIQSELKNTGQTLLVKNIDSGNYPNDEATLSTMGIKVSKTAYGNPLISGGMAYNGLYCSTVTGYSPSKFAIIASSKSGNVFSYSSEGQGAIYPTVSWTGGWGTMCPAILNVTAGNSATGIWLYENSIWKIWLQ